MMKRVKRLWAGGVPLKQAFWDYAVIYGLLVNLITDLGFYALLVSGGNTALVVLAFALPIPYNVLVTVAVWRSAGRYPGPKKWAEWASIGTVIWMAVLTVA